MQAAFYFRQYTVLLDYFALHKTLLSLDALTAAINVARLDYVFQSPTLSVGKRMISRNR
jgi:hypothetical protein